MTITEEGDSGRIVKLTAEMQKQPPTEVERLHCSLHCPPSDKLQPPDSFQLPNVTIQLEVLSHNIKELLTNHGGSLPLASVPYCYGTQFPPLHCLEGDEGVPLEHLLQTVKGVSIIAGVTGIKRLVDTSCVQPDVKPLNLLGPPPALAGHLVYFTKELVDLLKTSPGCVMPLYKFIPTYHHLYGKQCRVADYGFTKLRDLFDSLSHVVQTIGEGSKTAITLAHKTQVRRFTKDLLKVLCNQQDKRLLLSTFPQAFEKCFFKPFVITNYGVCFIEDMLKEIPEETVVIEETSSSRTISRNKIKQDYLISVFRRDQTAEEINRTKGFAKEVMELLRHSPSFSISFNKFIPAYHQHFGRQCRVSSYGVTKLAELFQLIPETVEIREEGEERVVDLTLPRIVSVVGEQVESVVRQVARHNNGLPLHQLESEYQLKFGHPIPYGRLGVTTVRQVMDLLYTCVRVTVTPREGEVVTPVDRNLVKTMARNVRKLLVEQKDGEMEIRDFINQMAVRFGCQASVDMLRRDLSNLVDIRGNKVALTKLHLVARDLENMIGGQGTMVEDLEKRYMAMRGHILPLESLGLDSVGDLLSALPDIFSVRGRGARLVICGNRYSVRYNMQSSVELYYKHAKLGNGK